MLKTSIIIIMFMLWLYILSVLKRAKLKAFVFIFGSVGLFFLLIAIGKPYGVWLFSAAVTKGVGLVGSLTGMFKSFYQSNLIQIQNTHGTILMFVDFECSGIIETAAFIGLILFYPLYERKEKFLLIFVGIFWIYVSNIIRLSVIAVIIFFFGDSVFYIAHSIIGRLIFYTFVTILYYNVFTKTHIVKNLASKISR